MIFMLLMVCGLLLWYIFSTYKDIACPPFILGIIMTSIYVVVTIYAGQKEISNVYYLCFLGAFLSFTIGFSLVCNHFTYSPKPIQKNLIMRRGVRSIVLLIADSAAIYQIIYFLPYLQDGLSFFQSMRIAQRNDGVTAGIASAPLETVFYLMLALYILNPIKENRNGVILSFPCIMSVAFTSAAKATWFYIMIIVAFMFVYIKRIKSGKLILIGTLVVIGVLVTFIWASYDYALSTGNGTTGSPLDSILDSLVIYFALPAMAFVRWIERDPTLYYGLYTFRFFFAVLNQFFPSIKVVDTIMPFYTINGLRGNVFTALHWYASDFGIPWMLFIYLLEGTIYAYLYRNLRAGAGGTVFSIVMLSMLMPPICEQFFSEVLFTTLSIWLQRAIVLFVLTRPGYVLIQGKAEKNIKRKKKIRIVWGRRS